MIKIAMVDDHNLLRDALAVVINNFDDCRVIVSADNGKQLVERLEPWNMPDLVILDLYMPVMDGFDTARWLKEHHPDILTLVLTMVNSELAMIQLLKLGVRGILKKDISPGELSHAIRTTISTGYYYQGGKLVNLLKQADATGPGVSAMSITDNEMKFLKLACTQLTYKEIAQIMEVSPRTIDNYRDSLFTKLDVDTRVGLVLYAIRNGVVWPDY